MTTTDGDCAAAGHVRPRHEVADIFRQGLRRPDGGRGRCPRQGLDRQGQPVRADSPYKGPLDRPQPIAWGSATAPTAGAASRSVPRVVNRRSPYATPDRALRRPPRWPHRQSVSVGPTSLWDRLSPVVCPAPGRPRAAPARHTHQAPQHRAPCTTHAAPQHLRLAPRRYPSCSASHRSTADARVSRPFPTRTRPGGRSTARRCLPAGTSGWHGTSVMPDEDGVHIAPDGSVSVRPPDGGDRWVRLHSARDPIAEADGLLAPVFAEGEPSLLVVVGLGLGYVVPVTDRAASPRPPQVPATADGIGPGGRRLPYSACAWRAGRTCPRRKRQGGARCHAESLLRCPGPVAEASRSPLVW